MSIKAWIFSDLHLDVGHNDARLSFKLPEERPEHDFVIIAGDIGDARVVYNPIGYATADEHTGFDPKIVVEVGMLQNANS